MTAEPPSTPEDYAMPMMTGTSAKTIAKNIREMHGGPRYAKVARKRGKKVANKMAIAAALSKARQSGATGYGMRMD